MARDQGSTIIRKPWGGHLEAQAKPRRRPGPDALEMTGLLLRKFTELCLLSTLLAVPFMYHLNFPARGVERLRNWTGDGDFFRNHLGPYVTGLMPVIDSKFSCWLVCGALMMAGYASTHLLGVLTGRRFFRQGPEESRPLRSPWRMVPLVCIFAYLIYSLATFLFWPPGVPPEAQPNLSTMVPGQSTAERMLGGLGGGGFFYSTVSWLQLAFGLLFLLVAEDTIRERTLVNKILGLMVFAGAANAAVVLMQKVEFGPLMAFWFQFPETETRNNLGAFIGHNTGLSSFLIAPFLIALTWLASVQPRNSRLFRWVMGLGLLTMAMALVLAQSRAVLPIIGAAAVAILVLLWRRACLLPKSRLYIGLPVALAFVVLTQLVPARFNPLYRQDVPLTKRVQEFRVSRLLTETRLRIFMVCTTQLLQDTGRLVGGHGFGSFQYVYPRAQGDYFERNPRTLLAPTPLRTPQAHNEYLQTVVETGLVGLAIALTGLGFLLRGAWLVLRRSLMPHHIAAEAAVFFAAAGMLAHLATDFPLRIPPLALYLTVLLAILSAGDRLWLFPTRAPLTEEELATSSATPPKPLVGNLRPGALAMAGMGIFGACLAALVFASGPTFGRLQTASTLENRAATFMTAIQSSPHLLDEARRDLEAARRIFWISGPINMSRARAQYLTAWLMRQRVDQLLRAGNTQEAQVMASQIPVTLGGALADLNLGLVEERYHYVYRLRSMVYAMLADFTAPPRREEFAQRSLEDLYLAVNMNPGDPEALFALIQTLERNPEANRSEIERYLRTLHYFHEGFFRTRVYSRVLDAMSLGEMRDARDRMQLIFEAVPDEPEFRLAWAQICLHVGDVETASRTLRARPQGLPDEKARIYRETSVMTEVHLLILSGSWEQALKTIQRENLTYVPPAQTMAYEMLIRRITKSEPARAEQLREELLKLGQENPINYQIVGSTALRFFNDPEEAIFWLEKRRAVADPPMDLQGAVLLADALTRLNRVAEAQALIPMIAGRGDEQSWARELSYRIADRIARLQPPAAAPEAAPK